MELGKRDTTLLRGVLVTLLVFALSLALVAYGIARVDARNESRQKAALRDALLRAALTCYAVEGRYPADVRYLEEHYGIVYDSERFIVAIDAFAQNVLPDIRVLTRGEA